MVGFRGSVDACVLVAIKEEVVGTDNKFDLGKQSTPQSNETWDGLKLYAQTDYANSKAGDTVTNVEARSNFASPYLQEKINLEQKPELAVSNGAVKTEDQIDTDDEAASST